MLAIKRAVCALALARFDVQPADAVLIDEVFGGGGGCSVFHSKGILEGEGRGASLFLCDGLFQFANLLNRLRHASAEIVDDGLAASAAKIVVMHAKLAFGFFDASDLLLCIRRDTGEKSGFVGGKIDIHGRGRLEGKTGNANYFFAKIAFKLLSLGNHLAA